MRRLLLVACVGLAGCHACESATAPDAGRTRKGDLEVTPVYAANPAPDPLAQKACHALHGIRAERRAACCGGAVGPNLPEHECVKMLSQSLQSHAVTLDAAKLTACEAAQTAQYDGCDWPSLDDNFPAAACAELIDGTLAAGAVCRSSLECARGLHCIGGGPTDLGHCGEPAKPPSACAVAVDPLASYSAQRLDEAHPECAGACERHRCVAALDAGVACLSSLQCAPNHHCTPDAGCVDGAFAAAGEPCVPLGCAGELRCIDGHCAAAKKSGEKCEHDSECVGACSRDAGVCAPRCR